MRLLWFFLAISAIVGLAMGFEGYCLATGVARPFEGFVVAGSVLVLAGWSGAWALRRWHVAPLEEFARGLDRWAVGDLNTPLDKAAIDGLSSVALRYHRAQEEMLRLLIQREAETFKERVKIETTLQNIPDGLVLTNLAGEVLYINPSGMEILGFKPETGKGLREMIASPQLRARVHGIIEKHSVADVIELAAHKAGGSVPCFYKTRVTLLSNAAKEDIGVLLILRDVTWERKLDAMKEEFFQQVAHDLRAPLFAIQGYLRLIERSIHPDPHQKGYFDAITQSCEKLTLFIQDTLDAARMEAGQLKLNITSIDPLVLLQRGMNLFRPLAEEKGIRVEVNLAPEHPSAIDVDERLMERVLYNLLSNALKFTPRGGAITIEVSRAGPDQAELSVADTGPGIPPALRTQIFEKFSQIDTGAPRTGFGLGLNICHKIVKLHKGKIWVDSQPGMGSQFVVRIPVKQEIPAAGA